MSRLCVRSSAIEYFHRRQVGVVWFVIGLVLIIAYQVYAHRTLWEKVPIMEQRADGLELGRTP